MCMKLHLDHDIAYTNFGSLNFLKITNKQQQNCTFMKFSSCLFIYKNKRTLLTKFSRNLLFVCLSSGEGREDDFFLAIEVSSLVTD